MVAGPGYEAEDDTLVVAIVGGLRARGQVRRGLRMAGREKEVVYRLSAKTVPAKITG